jgi:hypothetical protein
MNCWLFECAWVKENEKMKKEEEEGRNWASSRRALNFVLKVFVWRRRAVDQEQAELPRSLKRCCRVGNRGSGFLFVNLTELLTGGGSWLVLTLSRARLRHDETWETQNSVSIAQWQERVARCESNLLLGGSLYLTREIKISGIDASLSVLRVVKMRNEICVSQTN